jgi:small subunit ribosomal protein S16
MVIIRLSRSGAKKRPFYSIVATHKRNRRDGAFIERIGFYNPIAAGKETRLSIELDRLNHWTQHGADLSPAVERLLQAYKASQVSAIAA